MENKETQLNTAAEEEKIPATKGEQDFSDYDDSAEFAKEQQARDEKSEADKLLPPDPEATSKFGI